MACGGCPKLMPSFGPLGSVGEVVVSAHTEEIFSHTPLAEMRERARVLYEQNRDWIEAPLL